MHKRDNGDDTDAPEPDDDETENDFMDRCVDQMMGDDDSSVGGRRHRRLSDGMGRSRRAPDRQRAAAGETTFKTHAGEVQGMEFVLSDESVDRMGDIISAAGWDLKNFQKNPIALFGHTSSISDRPVEQRPRRKGRAPWPPRAGAGRHIAAH